MNTNKKFTIIGCGRVGIALAVFLSKAGYIPAAFYSKSLTSAQKALTAVGNGTVFNDPVDAMQGSGIIFIATPDNIIEEVCISLSRVNRFPENATLFHLSGALSSSILSSAKDLGVSTGSIHPLQSFAPFQYGQKSPFEGINISIEGNNKAVEEGEKIVKALKANDFTIPTNAKTLYHASAVVASNYLVTLEDFAINLLKLADLPESKAYEILEPLIQGTLNNIKSQGTVSALTGPIARGDEQIVSKHIQDIKKQAPELLKLYKLLGKHTLDIAKKRDEISKQAQDRLSDLFNK